MTQNILTAGNAITPGGFTGGNDGTLVLQVGPQGSQVNALTLSAAGIPTFNQLAQTLGSSGSVTLAGGLIIKWGSTVGPDNTVFNYATAFPNACYTTVIGNGDAVTNSAVYISLYSQTVSGFSIAVKTSAGASVGTNVRSNWISIGN